MIAREGRKTGWRCKIAATRWRRLHPRHFTWTCIASLQSKRERSQICLAERFIQSREIFTLYLLPLAQYFLRELLVVREGGDGVCGGSGVSAFHGAIKLNPSGRHCAKVGFACLRLRNTGGIRIARRRCAHDGGHFAVERFHLTHQRSRAAGRFLADKFGAQSLDLFAQEIPFTGSLLNDSLLGGNLLIHRELLD